jgi:hypothetical protein
MGASRNDARSHERDVVAGMNKASVCRLRDVQLSLTCQRDHVSQISASEFVVVVRKNDPGRLSRRVFVEHPLQQLELPPITHADGVLL